MGAGKSRKSVLRSTIGEADDGAIYEEDFPTEVLDMYNANWDRQSETDIQPVTDDYFYGEVERLGFDEIGPRTMTKMGVMSLYTEEINEDEEAPYNVRVAYGALKNISTAYEKATGEKIIDAFGFGKPIKEAGLLGMYAPSKRAVVITSTELNYSGWSINISRNFNAVPIKGSGAVSHELGHAVMYNLLDSKNKSKIEAFNKKVTSMSAVSTYGNYSHDEAFAEAFSLYAHGISKSTKAGSKYYSAFKSLMKDVGLSSLYGCISNT